MSAALPRQDGLMEPDKAQGFHLPFEKQGVEEGMTPLEEQRRHSVAEVADLPMGNYVMSM